jgi:hypothetical protein
MSQRTFAKIHGVRRSSLQHWLRRKKQTTASPFVVTFFEHPEGLTFLHQIVVAAQFVLTQLGPSGIRLMCQFLKLSGLSRFVSSSYGTLKQAMTKMEKLTLDYGDEEISRLGQGMPQKEITLCEDETFHPAPCLVAIDPVSGFILLETYADKRDAVTWDTHLAQALEGLWCQGHPNNQG